jgi:hypothetical protein
MEPFWLVWCENGGAPTVKHPSLDSAKREAERLAKANEGRTFHVLEVVGAATVRRVDWVERDIHGPGCDCRKCVPF